MKLGLLDYAVAWVLILAILIPLALLLEKLFGKKLFKKLGLLPDEEEGKK